MDYEILLIIGRASYPIFAILCGWNLAVLSHNPKRFANRVLLFGLALMTLSPILSPDILPLNPLVTLGLGLKLAYWMQKCQNVRTQAKIATSLTICATALNIYFPIDIVLSYGWVGLTLIPIVSFLATSVKFQIRIEPIYVILVAILSSQLNGEVYLNLISMGWALISISLITKNNLPRCPLPNNYWLYLSFPLSMVVPTILGYIIK
jgi:hypothetical protein